VFRLAICTGAFMKKHILIFQPYFLRML